jgi:hypothetical protein
MSGRHKLTLTLRFEARRNDDTCVSDIITVEKTIPDTFMINKRIVTKHQQNIISMLVEHYGKYSCKAEDYVVFECGPFKSEVCRCASYIKRDITLVIEKYMSFLSNSLS